MHETDEVLGTSSCVYSSGAGLVDGCDFEATGTPSAVDLFRYSAPHDLVLASAPSTTAGAYFSYDGGTANGVNGAGDTPKFYNTLDNGEDYADFVSSTPDCGTNIAIQDAVGCPGEDAGLTIFNDGRGEITILNAVGYSVPPPASTSAVLTTPTPGSTLTSSSVKFTWSAATGATAYVLALGSTGVGSTNLYYSGSTTATSVTATGLPVNGETIYARLYTNDGGTYVHNDYTFKAVTQAEAALTTPTPSSTLTSSSVKFTWSAASGATAYILELGSTGVGSYNLYYSGSTTATSATVNGLPINGETIYARLYTNQGGIWLHTDYTYKAVTEAQAALTSPTPSSTLTSSSVKFTWSAASGATAYLLSLGSTGAGSTNLYYSGSTTNTSVTVNGLPINGETIYARLFTEINGSWVHTDYTYKAVTEAQAVLTTPAPSSILTGSAVTFTWTTASGATGYILSLGSTGAGSTNLFYSGATTATSASVTKLPTNGETIYARLFTQLNGTWVHTDYTYTAQ
jgi:serine protease